MPLVFQSASHSETCIQLFFHCTFASRIWRWVFSMLGKAMLFPFSASAIWFSMAVSSGKKEKAIFRCYFLHFFALNIAVARNMCVFKITQPSLDGVLSKLKNDPSWALHDLKQDYKEHHIPTTFLVICLFSFGRQPFTTGFLYFAVELSLFSACFPSCSE